LGAVAAELLADPERLPLGSHCLSFHSSEEEAARHAISFLAGAPPEHDVHYWVRDEKRKHYYDEWIQAELPAQLGCVGALPGEQVQLEPDGTFRPVEEVLEFVRSHPDGVSAGADTLSHYWRPENVPEHVEYEAWFDRQPRSKSRFLCPYDLRRMPPDSAEEVIRDLAAAHSHVVLSASREPGARLLQLFIFTPMEALPPVLDEHLGWAIREELIEARGKENDLELTANGRAVVRDWSERAILDW
jgi:hypothetical protein